MASTTRIEKISHEITPFLDLSLEEEGNELGFVVIDKKIKELRNVLPYLDNEATKYLLKETGKLRKEAFKHKGAEL